MESGSITGNEGPPKFDKEPIERYIEELPEWKRLKIPSTERNQLKKVKGKITLARIDRILSATEDVHMLSILYPDTED